MFKKKNKLSEDEKQQQLGKMLLSIYETGYLDRTQAYKMSFIKGLVGGLGGVIGATVVVLLLLWILSLLDSLPFVGPIFENTQKAIENR